MRTIIAGGRDFKDYAELSLVCSAHPITEVLSGGAKGADSLGEKWAIENDIPFIRFEADWEFVGKRAGVIRNTTMSKNADALIAFWNGRSKGTKDMIEKARKEELQITIVEY